MLVSVAGRLFPPRFRISLRCAATEIEMCTAVEVEQGGFIEPNNAISVTGLSSGWRRTTSAPPPASSRCQSHARRCPRTFEQSSHGWKWGVDGWSPGSTMCTGLADSGQIALLEELRCRCGPKGWSIYLPRIEQTAEVVWEASADWSARRVIATLVCPATHVGRIQAYADLQSAREFGLLPSYEDMKAR
ncbi:hypothetical protein [Streptomyces sp. NPDC088746]|uniref:hypothetical protein n=1 Tax=Streptomyces sp. NPDC088746 TaxID=3365885 RepID=UPI00380B1180